MVDIPGTFRLTLLLLAQAIGDTGLTLKQTWINNATLAGAAADLGVHINTTSIGAARLPSSNTRMAALSPSGTD